MKTFYEMMMYVEEQGLQAPGGQEIPKEQGPQEMEDGLGDEAQKQGDQGETKHYMFFSNLKTIKDRAEAILAMDKGEVDRMLEDGHDWAADHISTSKDDVEEVYNWLSSSMGGKDEG